MSHPETRDPPGAISALGPKSFKGQSFVGLALAALVVGTWVALHVHGVFLHGWTMAGIVGAPVLILLQCWLSVGLFIVAHDCMHGSLAPGRPRVNRWVGRLALALYAGFWFDALLSKHAAHHREPGTAGDPDFDPPNARRFWPWYRRFFLNYFGWRQLAAIAAVLAAYLLLGVHPANALAFWAVPALLSSVQLFAFGTYLPHRHDEAAFADEHRARSCGYSWPVSLLTCFHFGHHHEHHLAPGVPWWRLPAVRRSLSTPR